MPTSHARARSRRRPPPAPALAGRIAVAASLLLAPAAVRAAEPLPGESRITMEAHLAPAQVFPPATSLELCVQNVNRRTATAQALVAGDAWVFRTDPACGTFAAISGCPGDLSLTSAALT